MWRARIMRCKTKPWLQDGRGLMLTRHRFINSSRAPLRPPCITWLLRRLYLSICSATSSFIRRSSRRLPRRCAFRILKRALLFVRVP
jgi:hypothetical protein